MDNNLNAWSPETHANDMVVLGVASIETKGELIGSEGGGEGLPTVTGISEE